ncbi:hypothetical protein KR222_008678 [Zaprionus bogoriensis]|nr:hypothetical protein KR222_008678 [Zaprionus bogoriensis]
MFRNQYDSDVTVWSPQGRLFQIEYAMEAVNLGSATVGLKGEDHAVLVALSKPSTELGISQPKIISIDRHVGISISGITADARVLSQYLRTECLSYKHSYSTTFPISRLVSTLGNKMQVSTQRYDRRPFGVGLLLAGYDEKGAHIYQIMPSANVFNCRSMAIGARSQGARSYLGRHGDIFTSCNKDDIICHGIQAISSTIPSDEELNITIGIVGKNEPFRILSNNESVMYKDMANIGLAREASAELGENSVIENFDEDTE